MPGGLRDPAAGHVAHHCIGLGHGLAIGQVRLTAERHHHGVREGGAPRRLGARHRQRQRQFGGLLGGLRGVQKRRLAAAGGAGARCLVANCFVAGRLVAETDGRRARKIALDVDPKRGRIDELGADFAACPHAGAGVATVEHEPEIDALVADRGAELAEFVVDDAIGDDGGAAVGRTHVDVIGQEHLVEAILFVAIGAVRLVGLERAVAGHVDHRQVAALRALHQRVERGKDVSAGRQPLALAVGQSFGRFAGVGQDGDVLALDAALDQQFAHLDHVVARCGQVLTLRQMLIGRHTDQQGPGLGPGGRRHGQHTRAGQHDPDRRAEPGAGQVVLNVA